VTSRDHQTVLLIGAPRRLSVGLREQLEEKSCFVGYNTTGAAALAKFQHAPPDLLIVCDPLPDMSAKRFLYELNRRAGRLQPGVMVLDAEACPEKRTVFYRLGALDVAPIDIESAELALKTEAFLRLMEANRLRVLVEWAGASAHELRQPLCVLSCYTALLKRMASGPPRNVTAVSSRIEKAVEGMTRIVECLEGIPTYRRRTYGNGIRITRCEQSGRRL